MIANVLSATRNAFPNNNGKKGCGKSWRPRKFGTNHVDPVDQDQDDNYEYDEEDEEDGDEQDGQDDHEDEQEEDEDAEQDPEAAPDDDDDQYDDVDLQKLFGAFVQFMRAGKKMRSKTKGWKKSPQGKRQREVLRTDLDHPALMPPPRRQVNVLTAGNTDTGKVILNARTSRVARRNPSVLMVPTSSPNTIASMPMMKTRMITIKIFAMRSGTP